MGELIYLPYTWQQEDFENLNYTLDDSWGGCPFGLEDECDERDCDHCEMYNGFYPENLHCTRIEEVGPCDT